MGFMPVPSSGGDFKTYVTYNSKAGRWYTKSDGKDEDLFEVTDMTAIFDMSSIITGWFKFTPGAAPERVMDPSLAEAALSPGAEFKRGFLIDLYSEKNLLGLREFSSTAGIVIEAMNTLYDIWMAAPENASGKVPVVRCTGVHAVTNKHGTNYQPSFAIVDWVDRPAAIAESSVSAHAAAASATAAPSAPAQHMPPPAAGSAKVGAPVF